MGGSIDQIVDAPKSVLEYSRLADEELTERIARRKTELNAVILGHNYQRVEIQEVSDYLGDSLGLSQEAAATDADVIVFCGVTSWRRRRRSSRRRRRC
jgi:quinolinate synthase